MRKGQTRIQRNFKGRDIPSSLNLPGSNTGPEHLLHVVSSRLLRLDLGTQWMPRELLLPVSMGSLLYTAWRHFPNLLTLGSSSSSIIKRLPSAWIVFPYMGPLVVLARFSVLEFQVRRNVPKLRPVMASSASNRRVTVAAFIRFSQFQRTGICLSVQVSELCLGYRFFMCWSVSTTRIDDGLSDILG